MKTIKLSGSPRESVGKKDSKLLRRENRIPAVIYGGKEQVHLHISENDAKKLVFTSDVYIVELEISGNTYRTIVKDVQMHPVTDRITHFDFLEVEEGKETTVKLPLVTTGFSSGVRNGGRLVINFRKVSCVGKLNDLPENVEVDITNLKIGDKVRISELQAGSVKFVDAPSAVVVAVQMSRNATLDEEEEETTEEATEEAAAE